MGGVGQGQGEGEGEGEGGGEGEGEGEVRVTCLAALARAVVTTHETSRELGLVRLGVTVRVRAG